ncbi:putative catabolic L-serine/threonine dehydratase [Suhomyces tanzawaensis NRRL Y-17324]|uniref:L-serine ammonia-lyase n=1 Tax=Suhomyces tanzawaensis NRRL Y-17324 TaxID=984487 RepID=A0A1E4SC96_9ASCO|nr:putative catabolic L-serine/threonine dehydratase [Suhomyces tanzawaensis NRRL Y-17324]ODV77134.1 putative catabolic L-serine/threonine dehydratase [Suhomyces tanzawaensis NRRL Y-17324]
MSVQLSSPLPQAHVTTTLTDVTDKLPMKPPCRILLKNEMEQPSGSFKLRGIGNLIHKSIMEATASSTNEIQVFASSGGNAGLAAAYLAWFYNVKCTVVLPVHSKPVVQRMLLKFNAKIVLFGNSINEADQHLRNLMTSLDTSTTTPIYCHPFSHPLVWQGHSTLVDEVVQQLLAPEVAKIRAMVCSCGGGGLYNGIYQGMVRNNITNLDILLIETNQAPTLAESLKADKLITLNSVNSLATSLACSYTTQQTLLNYKDTSVVSTKLELIDDLDAIRACVDFERDFGKVVEPACGAALSILYSKINLLYKNFGHLKEDDIVVLVACGGSCTTAEDIGGFKQMLNRNDNRL